VPIHVRLIAVCVRLAGYQIVRKVGINVEGSNERVLEAGAPDELDRPDTTGLFVTVQLETGGRTEVVILPLARISELRKAHAVRMATAFRSAAEPVFHPPGCGSRFLDGKPPIDRGIADVLVPDGEGKGHPLLIVDVHLLGLLLSCSGLTQGEQADVKWASSRLCRSERHDSGSDQTHHSLHHENPPLKKRESLQ